jgi:hypothetical protein
MGNQPLGDFNHLDARHRKTQRQAKSRGQHFVGKDANVLGIVLKLGYVGRAVRRPEQVGLRSSSKSAQVLDGGDALRHGHLLRSLLERVN